MSINYVAFLAQVAVLETLYAMMMCLSPIRLAGFGFTA